jgi:hypothetical protein
VGSSIGQWAVVVSDPQLANAGRSTGNVAIPAEVPIIAATMRGLARILDRTVASLGEGRGRSCAPVPEDRGWIFLKIS